MKIATTTADIAGYVDGKSIAAPVPYFSGTGFKHLDMSFYRVIYPDSPWIQKGDGWKREAEEAMEYAIKYGFDFCQAHSPDGEHFVEGEKREALMTAVRHTIEACAMLGIKCTVLHAQAVKIGRNLYAPKGIFLKKNAEFYRRFEETAERYGVDVLTENTSWAWCRGCYGRTGKEMNEILEAARMNRLKICWDTGHANVEGLNQYEQIVAMGNNVRALHLQDNFGNCDSHMMPMTGTVNYDEVLRGITKIGYTGAFTFEADKMLRPSGTWPNYRRNVMKEDKLSMPPLAVLQKQIGVLYGIGEWMLDSYGVKHD